MDASATTRALLNSQYHQGLLKVSWKLIEHKINLQEVMGKDVQSFYAIYQDLTLEDLARPSWCHDARGVVPVIRKVLNLFGKPAMLHEYLCVLGRMHDFAGVDQRYLDAFAAFLSDRIQTLGGPLLGHPPHGLWDDQVVLTWRHFLAMVAAGMKKGYVRRNLLTRHNAMLTEQKNAIVEVWGTMQANILHYLGNTLLLPLVMRSNRVISRYFLTYETSVDGLCFSGGGRRLCVLEKTKHGCWFLSHILAKVVPCLDTIASCQQYLEGLGRKHRDRGVKPEHLDLMGLVYCNAVRAVMVGQGMKGGPLQESTKVWLKFIQLITYFMKKGYEHNTRT